MIESMSAAITSLRTAFDMTKSMVNIRDRAIIEEKTIELKRVILEAMDNAITAKADQSTYLDRIHDLEEEIASLRAWDAEKQRYKLHEPRGGAFTYILKEEEGDVEPSHQLCANCYNVHGEKSILHTETKNPGRTQYLVCDNCDSEMLLRGAQHHEHRPKVITKKPRR